MHVLLLCSTGMFKALLLLQRVMLCYFVASTADEHNAVCHTHRVKYVRHIIYFI
jgi:uncharacterized membrane protein